MSRYSDRVRVLHVDMCFFNDTATTEIYTLSLHDALPISVMRLLAVGSAWPAAVCGCPRAGASHADGAYPAGAVRLPGTRWTRSEEHTSELQSRQYLVCRLLLEKQLFVQRWRWSVHGTS